MSKHMSYICDICGKEVIGHSAQAISGESAQIKLWGPGDYRAGPGQRIDLCIECYENFVNFLDGAKMDSESD